MSVNRAVTDCGTVLARQLVGAGITAVRDVGTTHDIALGLKQAVARHIIPDQRIFWSGQIIATTDWIKIAAPLDKEEICAAIDEAHQQGARILGLDDKLGTIAPDHLADILVIEGNPVEDLRNLRRIKFVMAGGQTVPAP